MSKYPNHLMEAFVNLLSKSIPNGTIYYYDGVTAKAKPV